MPKTRRIDETRRVLENMMITSDILLRENVGQLWATIRRVAAAKIPFIQSSTSWTCQGAAGPDANHRLLLAARTQCASLAEHGYCSIVCRLLPNPDDSACRRIFRNRVLLSGACGVMSRQPIKTKEARCDDAAKDENTTLTTPPCGYIPKECKEMITMDVAIYI